MDKRRAFKVAGTQEQLDLGKKAVLQLIASGELAAFDVSATPGIGRPRWRITQAAIDEFIAARTNRPKVKPQRRKRANAEIKEFF